MDGDAREREQAYAPAVSDLGRLFDGAAAELARQLAPARRVLDVGAGSGVWSLAMIAATPDARATALDLPPVLPAFLARAAALGLSERVSTIAGDFHEFVLPARAFDRVVLANVLHLEQEAAAQALVLSSSRALAPGGELVIVDMLPTGPHGALAHAAYELHLAMRTRAGRAHAQGAIERWCRNAELEPRALIPISGRLRGMTALIARA
jgi:ubiquinone/menaquinone biosynthesis C-methylase UbiE